MDWEKDYEPALSAAEYRKWMVAAFHNTTWHHVLAALALSTKGYVEQVAKLGGRQQLASVLLSVMTNISSFKRDIAAGNDAAVAAANMALFVDAELRLRAVARYCLDNNVFQQGIQTPQTHPTEAIQTVVRDPDNLEMIGSRTVYKFG